MRRRAVAALVAGVALALALAAAHATTPAPHGVAAAAAAQERLGPDDPASARRAAAEVLDDARFERREIPRPLRGVLRRLGEAVLGPTEALFSRLAAGLPGGRATLWILLALVLLAAAAALAQRAARRAGRGEARDPAGTPSGERPLTAEALRRSAEEAERAGDLDAALRLRFRAGLADLGAAGLVELRPGLHTSEVRRVLRSPDFELLAEDFDRVTYGGRDATPDDVLTARERWPRVGREVRAR